MFTGLVELLATVRGITPAAPGVRLQINAPGWAAETELGESIAVSGCCLTLVERSEPWLAFQAGPETLSRTTLGGWRPGSAVNLERSLRAGDRLGGHFVTGHIDGQGEVARVEEQGDWRSIWFRVSEDLIPCLVCKGSVAVDGVSLTVVNVESDRFSVQLIPHTLAVTTLGKLRLADRVNLETDLLAKYVGQQLRCRP